jgi:hypothetical protein
MINPDPIRGKNLETLSVITSNSDINALRKRMDSFGVEIVFPAELQSNPCAVTCCSAMLNLLPRLIPLVRYTGPSILLKDFPPSHLSKINVGNNVWNPSVTIVFGSDEKNEVQNVIYVGSSGWSCYISTKKPCMWNQQPTNFLSALYTAGLVVGEVFKYLLPEVQSEKISHVEYDLITHGRATQPVVEPLLPESAYFEDLIIVGCGAVGQALVFALKSTIRLWGTVTLIDNDKFEASNEQRYIGAFEEHRGMQKIDLLSQWLTQINPGLAILKAPIKYEEYARLGKPLGAEVVAAVDNEKTRINIQAGLPKILWNVWTDTSQNTLRYGAGHHTLDGPYQCAACGYYPTDSTPSQMKMNSIRTGLPVEEVERKLTNNEITTEQDILRISQATGVSLDFLRSNVGKPFHELLHGECGVYRLEFHEGQAVTPAPHTSFLAGVFLASQIILRRMKLDDNAKLMDSVADFDAFGVPNANCLMKKQRNPKCFCNDLAYEKAYKEKWD